MDEQFLPLKDTDTSQAFKSKKVDLNVKTPKWKSGIVEETRTSTAFQQNKSHSEEQKSRVKRMRQERSMSTNEACVAGHTRAQSAAASGEYCSLKKEPLREVGQRREASNASSGETVEMQQRDESARHAKQQDSPSTGTPKSGSPVFVYQDTSVSDCEEFGPPSYENFINTSKENIRKSSSKPLFENNGITNQLQNYIRLNHKNHQTIISAIDIDDLDLLVKTLNTNRMVKHATKLARSQNVLHSTAPPSLERSMYPSLVSSTNSPSTAYDVAVNKKPSKSHMKKNATIVKEVSRNEVIDWNTHSLDETCVETAHQGDPLNVSVLLPRQTTSPNQRQYTVNSQKVAVGTASTPNRISHFSFSSFTNPSKMNLHNERSGSRCRRFSTIKSLNQCNLLPSSSLASMRNRVRVGDLLSLTVDESPTNFHYGKPSTATVKNNTTKAQGNSILPRSPFSHNNTSPTNLVESRVTEHDEHRVSLFSQEYGQSTGSYDSTSSNNEEKLGRHFSFPPRSVGVNKMDYKMGGAASPGTPSALYNSAHVVLGQQTSKADSPHPLNANILDSILLYAVWNNSSKTVRYLLQTPSGLSTEAQDPLGRTCLHLAAIASNVEVTAILMDAGAIVNRFDRYNFITPWFCAASHGSRELIKTFLDKTDAHASPSSMTERNCDQNEMFNNSLKSDENRTSNHMTETGEPTNVIQPKQIGRLKRAFENHSADATISSGIRLGDLFRNDSEQRGATKPMGRKSNSPLLDFGLDTIGVSALHYAVKANNVEGVKTLLEEGAITNQVQLFSETPLHIAASMGYDDCVQLLIKHGASLEVAVGPLRMTALHLAAQEGNTESVAHLLSGGAKIDALNSRMQTALHLACLAQSSETVEILLIDGAQPNTQDCELRTPLHCAIVKGSRSYECVKFLIQYGCDVNMKDKFGYTPLHIAALNEYSFCASLLLSHGSDVTSRTNGGATALSMIVRKVPSVLQKFDDMLDQAITIADNDINDVDCEFKMDFRVLTPFNQMYRNQVNKQITTTASVMSKRNQESLKKPQSPYRNGTTPCRQKSPGHNSSQSSPSLPSFGTESSMFIAFIEIGHNYLLKHPLCESFLHLKWLKIRKFFLTSLFFHFGLTILYTYFVMTVYTSYGGECMIINHCETDKDIDKSVNDTLTFPVGNDSLSKTDAYIQTNGTDEEATSESSFHSSPIIYRQTVDSSCLQPFQETCKLTEATLVAWIMLMLTTLILACKELFQAIHSKSQYFLQWENWIQMGIVVNVIMVCWFQNNPLQAMSERGGVALITSWQHHMAAIGIFFVWTETMLMVGRLPTYGIYVQMFTKVAGNFAKFFTAYFCLIVAFALSFCVIFPNYIGFNAGPIAVFVKTIVMMIGEVEYENFIYENGQPLFPVTGHAIILIFVLLVSLILMNLMVGLAVSDIQGLQESAGLDRLVRQTQLISHIESMLFSSLLSFLPSTFLSVLHQIVLVVPHGYSSTFTIRPNDLREDRLPRDIIENVHMLLSTKHRSRKQRPFGWLGARKSGDGSRFMNNSSFLMTHHYTNNMHRFVEEKLDCVVNMQNEFRNFATDTEDIKLNQEETLDKMKQMTSQLTCLKSMMENKSHLNSMLTVSPPSNLHHTDLKRFSTPPFLPPMQQRHSRGSYQGYVDGPGDVSDRLTTRQQYESHAYNTDHGSHQNKRNSAAYNHAKPSLSQRLSNVLTRTTSLKNHQPQNVTSSYDKRGVGGDLLYFSRDESVRCKSGVIERLISNVSQPPMIHPQNQRSAVLDVKRNEEDAQQTPRNIQHQHKISSSSDSKQFLNGNSSSWNEGRDSVPVVNFVGLSKKERSPTSDNILTANVNSTRSVPVNRKPSSSMNGMVQQLTCLAVSLSASSPNVSEESSPVHHESRMPRSCITFIDEESKHIDDNGEDDEVSDEADPLIQPTSILVPKVGASHQAKTLTVNRSAVPHTTTVTNKLRRQNNIRRKDSKAMLDGLRKIRAARTVIAACSHHSSSMSSQRQNSANPDISVLNDKAKLQ